LSEQQVNNNPQVIHRAAAQKWRACQINTPNYLLNLYNNDNHN